VAYRKGFVNLSLNALLRRAEHSACMLARVLDLPYKEIFPPDIQIFSLAKCEFSFPNRPILTL
jgi:hypothetical protein